MEFHKLDVPAHEGGAADGGGAPHEPVLGHATLSQAQPPCTYESTIVIILAVSSGSCASANGARGHWGGAAALHVAPELLLTCVV